MKFLDKILNKFFIDPLFTETIDGQEINGYARKQQYLQDKINDLDANRTDLLTMAEEIEILSSKLDKKSKDLTYTKSQFQLLAENSVDVIWKTNVELDTVYVSPSIFNLTGYTPEEFVKLTLEERHDEETIVVIRRELYGHIIGRPADEQKKAIVTFPGKIRHKDGSLIYMRITCKAIFEDDIFFGIQGTTSDSTKYVEFLHCQDMSLRVLRILNNDDDFKTTVELVLNEIKTLIKCDAVGIRLANGDDYPYFVQEGFSDDFLFTENSLISRNTDNSICRNADGTVNLECTCGLVISGKTDSSDNLFTDDGSAWTNDSANAIGSPGEDKRHNPRDRCIHDGYASVALIPIKMKSKIVGILQINAYRKNVFTKNSIKSLEVIATNIGEALLRKKAEEALLKSEIDSKNKANFLESILENSPFAMQIMDANGMIIKVNQALRDTMDLTDDMLINKYNVFDDENVPKHILNKVFYDLKAERCIGYWTGANAKIDNSDLSVSSEHWLDIAMFPIIDESGKLINVVCQYVDITEVRKAENELKRMNQLLEGVLRVQTDCIARFTLDRQVVFANKAYSIIFCGTEEIDKCRPLDFFESVHPDDVDIVEKCMQQLIKDAPHVGMTEYRVVDFQGNTRLFSWQAQGILNQDGNVYEIQAMGRDVVESLRSV